MTVIAMISPCFVLWDAEWSTPLSSLTLSRDCPSMIDPVSQRPSLKVRLQPLFRVPLNVTVCCPSLVTAHLSSMPLSHGCPSITASLASPITGLSHHCPSLVTAPPSHASLIIAPLS